MPEPLPAAVLSVIQESDFVAVQEQPVVHVTVKFPLLPLPPTTTLAGERV